MRFLSGLVAALLAVGSTASKSRLFMRQNATTAPYELKTGPLDTPWTTEVGTDPWPEYPRPQLQRSQEWQNLNGVWQYSNTTNGSINSPPFGQDLQKSVLVPFCLESALSGIMESYTIWSWYRTTFDTPSWTAGNRVLLNFAAVDYEATVFVNGQKVTSHTGGYWSFTVDITDHLSANGTNELIVHVFDPTDLDPYDVPLGKQTLTPEHIFYTPCSGIWQTVWLESAPAEHITQLDISADMNGKVTGTVHSSGNASSEVEITLWLPGSSTKAAITHQAAAGTEFEFTVDNAELWSPDSPTLYNLTVKMGDDTIQSYTGFRTISKGEVDGVQRPLLNGEFIFQFGTLDQGFWPDGIYTPPSKEAMRYDLETLKKIGYNMVRKHIKVETALWFQACDELGLLVLQDMPSLRPQVNNPAGGCSPDIPVNDPSATDEFGRQLELLVEQHKSYPSIVTWVIYNEGWGQARDPPYIPNGYPEFGFTDRIRELDPTRLVNSVTGWVDHGAGDFSDNHHYANPQCGTPFYSRQSPPYDPKRIGIQGEFGGIGQNISDEHAWKVEQSINAVNETYELDATVEIWNYRAHIILSEILDQVKRFACSAAVWTQTTDVEGEVNGMLTYDRRLLRPDLTQWNDDIQALYDAAAARGGGNSSVQTNLGSWEAPLEGS